MREKIKEYFTFTRKERLGVIVLLIIILILFIVPYWIRRPPGTEDPEATRQFAPLIEKFEKDSLRPDHRDNAGGSAYGEKRPAYNSASREDRYGKTDADARPPVTPFYFDPNKIGEADWLRLGLSERQSRTLVHYTGKGGRFRSAADLEKIYGLSAGDRERLMPYVRISSPAVNRNTEKPWIKTADNPPLVTRQNNPPVLTRQNNPPLVTRQNNPPVYLRQYPHKTPAVIDINRADSIQWEQLPGIGEKLAARIIRFREKLGGFYRVDQVAETFGLPDSSFQKIRPWLKSDTSSVQRMDLNSVSAATLRQHPYIRWKLADVLMRYREQHGKFASVDELGQLALIDAETLNRLRPYLVVL